MGEYRHNFKVIAKGRGPSPLNSVECVKNQHHLPIPLERGLQGWSGHPTCATNPVGCARPYRGCEAGWSGWSCTGFVANFAQDVMKELVPLSVEGIKQPGSRTVRSQCGPRLPPRP